MKIRPVLLSGGSGTRLWPLSRRSQPKQFAQLLGPSHGDESLFARALHLTSGREMFLPPVIVGNAEHKFLIIEALDKAGIRNTKILLEPEGRNTAAAAITAALAEDAGNVLHLVMPTDHIIADREGFLEAVRRAQPCAEAGHIVLFGMTPAYPETGYGYITPGPKTDWKGIAHIGSFREKPDNETAQKLIAQQALWNSGIFFYGVETLIDEVSQLAPDIISACRDAVVHGEQDSQCLTLAAESYQNIDPQPFDRLVMEKTDRGCVAPCDIGWSDAGSWQALWRMDKHDEHGNSFAGPVVSYDVEDAFVRSDGPTVAVVGMKDVTVVATRDAVLITPRERSQDVKTIVAEIERACPALAADPARVVRPWGSYEGLAEGGNFQVKHIIVQPGRSLSLQKHYHRAEHWVVVGGTAEIERDGVTKLLFPNESAFVPRGAVHRLTNPGKIPLHLIEVQSGDYLGEDDIIRFEDRYGRADSDAVPAQAARAELPDSPRKAVKDS